MDRCAGGSDPTRCCVGDPWANINVYYDDPLQPEVIRVAAERGIEPHALDWHVEAIHGWEPHDEGYADAVIAAAECIESGGCDRCPDAEPHSAHEWYGRPARIVQHCPGVQA